MSYKVAVKVNGESGFSYNAQRFPTAAEADQAGKDLMSRWFAVEEYEVQKSTEPANYWFIDGRAIPIEGQADLVIGGVEPVLEDKPKKKRKASGSKKKKKEQARIDESGMGGIR